MSIYKIAVIAGDGIGQEVIPAGRAALQAATKGSSVTLEFTDLPWGCDYYVRQGRMMDADGFERLARFDAIYLGAIGSPAVPDHIAVWDLLLPLRQRFQQYVNLLPFVAAAVPLGFELQGLYRLRRGWPTSRQKSWQISWISCPSASWWPNCGRGNRWSM